MRYRMFCSSIEDKITAATKRILTSRLLFRYATLECEGVLLTIAIQSDWTAGAIADNYSPDALIDIMTRD